MKAIGGFLLGAIVLALVGGVCLAAGILDREWHTRRSMSFRETMTSRRPSWTRPSGISSTPAACPWVGNGPVNDVRARKAALRYWQRQYAAVVPEIADPVGNVAA